jgi:BirA family biotin operon repressor/biotin-[acetyl-CoA-carboxylase] ligase
LTTYPDQFHTIHLDRCESTNNYIRENLARLESDFPLMVSAAAQLSGRGRDERGWFSAPDLGIYATFAFHLATGPGLPLLAIASGVAVAEMLRCWIHREFTLKWPNDVLAGGKKIAGILCENMVKAEKITCLVGIGINVNHGAEDFPVELQERAGSLRQLTGKEWPVAAGRERLAASMAYWLNKLVQDRRSTIVRRARKLSRSFQGQEIAFHQQDRFIRGIFLDIAPDGGVLLQEAGREKKVFYHGEIIE